MKNSKMRGFTLIEVMVVVVILGILAAIIVPNVVGKDERARVETTKASLQSIASALEMYKLDNGTYPTTQEGLSALVNKPESAKHWAAGGYLKDVPKDSWGNDFQYVAPGPNHTPYDLYSFGADGAQGGDGDNADIHAH